MAMSEPINDGGPALSQLADDSIRVVDKLAENIKAMSRTFQVIGRPHDAIRVNAEIMEVLGNLLDAHDCVGEDDEWVDDIFERVRAADEILKARQQ
jgi:hypothetical protein